MCAQLRLTISETRGARPHGGLDAAIWGSGRHPTVMGDSELPPAVPPPACCTGFLWVTGSQGDVPASLEQPLQAVGHEWTL